MHQYRAAIGYKMDVPPGAFNRNFTIHLGGDWFV